MMTPSWPFCLSAGASCFSARAAPLFVPHCAPLGVDAPSQSSAAVSLDVFPSPSEDGVTISVDGFSNDPGRIVISNTLGQIVFSTTKQETIGSFHWNRNDTQGLRAPAGVYECELITSTALRIASKRFILK